MSHLPGSQAIKHLAEFLAVISGEPDEASTVRSGLEVAAEMLDTEVAALLRDESVASLGFPHGQVPTAILRTAARERWSTLYVHGLGDCHLLVTNLYGRVPGQLLFGRSWALFSSDEVNLVRAMARVLSLTLDIVQTMEAERSLRERSQRQAEENSRLVRSLQERQRLVAALSAIERAISRRAPLQQILDTITAEARQLLDDDAAMLRLVDSDDPDHLLLASGDAAPGLLDEQTWRLPIAAAEVSAPAIARGTTVVTSSVPARGFEPTETPTPADTPTPVRAAPQAGQVGQGRELAGGLRHGIAVPVRESDAVVGCLTVASTDADRVYSGSDQQTMHAFAEQVSLALTDAKTVQAMHEAFHDPLTGLASRALLVNQLGDRLSPKRTTSPTGLLLIDLSRFKVVNDTLGYAAGDKLLVEVGNRIVRTLRSGDTAARFGGDEFAALILDLEVEGAAIVAERVIEAIGKPYLIDGRQVFVNASIGIAVGMPGQSVEELLRNADVAMYRAKRRGDGCAEVFQPVMHEELLERMQMETDLRAAIDRQDLMVFYQPIVSVETGDLEGFEALARWDRPGRGMVPPSDFIPLAEETGLILPIGRWILGEACRQIAEWQQAIPDLPELTISVNLSARQLQHPALVDEVRAALESSGLSPQMLILEITESLLHQDVDEAVRRLHELKDLGIRLAIDDFGTGYSSLSCLHRFPVDIMKIDKSFVHALITDAKAATFARTIVRLGQMLNLVTVAEGIENDTQLDRIREARCDFGQGYLFAPPLTREMARTYLTGMVDAQAAVAH